ncbi:hypothetical protein J4526_07725 [Desulfurococcaceae archaeon MEX13E-LK6-19]|nr:hypothetical protein J4526_07725 [Desulfurococcaceae archaeon MEX13E-LK6-19]
MDYKVLDEIDSLRRRLYDELDNVCSFASLFFYVTLLVIIISIVLGIALGLATASIIAKHAKPYQFPEEVLKASAPELVNVFTIFIIITSIIGLVLYYILIKFMRTSINGSRILLDIDKKLREIGKNGLLMRDVEYIYPLTMITSYPGRILVLVLLNVPLSILGIHFLFRGVLLGVETDLAVGCILTFISFVINLAILFMVYRFFNSLKYYYNVERAGTVANLFVVSAILSLLGILPVIGNIVKIFGFIITIIYLVFLYVMVGDLRRETARIIARLNNIVDELRQEVEKSSSQEERDKSSSIS